MNSDQELPVLYSKRLKLRPICDEDFLFMRQLDSDPAVMKYIGNGKPKSEAQTRESISNNYARYMKRGIGLYIAEEAVTSLKVGRAGLFAKEEGSALVWEIGLALHPAYWRKGYGKEIAICLRDWALKNLDTKFVVFVVQLENLASIELARKLGMKRWKDVSIDGHAHAVFRTS
jgi:RimJ/RimL family protein N-acetyltransferase